MRIYVYSALVLALVACGPKSENATSTATTTETTATESTTTTATETTTQATATDTTATAATAPASSEEKPMSDFKDKVAELHTTAGDITFRFFPDKAPNHVRNFLDLAEKGFYNGTKFHRIIPGFMVQGGDPNTVSGPPESWGTGGSPNRLKAEFNDIPHKRGIVSMARSQDPNSASSQFFIVTSDSRFLDGQYTAFGQVTKGMDVADKIVNAPRGANDRPNNPTAIKSITVRDAKDDEKGPAPKG